MGDVVNLRLARKRRRRERAEVIAAENRVDFGRSKAERRLSETERRRAARDLEGHKIVRPDDG